MKIKQEHINNKHTSLLMRRIIPLAISLFLVLVATLFWSDFSFDGATEGVNIKNSSIIAELQMQNPDVVDLHQVSSNDDNNSPPESTRDATVFISNDVDGLFGISSPLVSLPSSETKDVVIVFVNDDYLDTFSVWIHYYKKHNHSRRILCLVAMSNDGNPTYQKIKSVFETNQQNITHELGPVMLINAQMKNLEKKNEIWRFRVKLVRRIMDTFPDVNVLMTDLDALWLKDPEPLYLARQHESSDIVSSRGIFPAPCALTNDTENLFTVCMGFIFLRNTPAARSFMSVVESVLPRYNNDDQRSTNCALKHRYQRVSEQTLEDGSIALSWHNESALNVTLLPYTQVVRFCRQAVESSLQQVSVAHCLTGKHGEKKLKSFQDFGFLPKKYPKFQWDRDNTTEGLTRRTLFVDLRLMDVS